jgi:hypothetical protein
VSSIIQVLLKNSHFFKIISGISTSIKADREKELDTLADIIYKSVVE